jgi:hypothetical protein
MLIERPLEDHVAGWDVRQDHLLGPFADEDIKRRQSCWPIGSLGRHRASSIPGCGWAGACAAAGWSATNLSDPNPHNHSPDAP